MENKTILRESRDFPFGECVTAYFCEDCLVGLTLGSRSLAALEKRLMRQPGGTIREGTLSTQLWQELEQYFAGQRKSFSIPLGLYGTTFQVAVWQALTAVPYGQTIGYRALGERAGTKNGGRAVGSAMAANPIALLVPCHRVLPRGGGLGSYSAGRGAPTKRALLCLEGVTTGEGLQ